MYEYSTDNELLHALKRKDPRAFFAVFDRFARQLQFFVNRMISNTQAAEDIVTETFMKVFERPDDFTSLGRLKSFLFTTANNASINYIKSQKREEERIRAYRRYLSVDEGEENLLRSEALQAIRTELEALPHQVREVVRMSLLEGKKLDEIAATLSIAYKTVQNHKTKGYKILRQRLILKGLYGAAILIFLSDKTSN